MPTPVQNGLGHPLLCPCALSPLNETYVECVASRPAAGWVSTVGYEIYCAQFTGGKFPLRWKCVLKPSIYHVFAATLFRVFWPRVGTGARPLTVTKNRSPKGYLLFLLLVLHLAPVCVYLLYNFYVVSVQSLCLFDASVI